jgi:hypothetical protein
MFELLSSNASDVLILSINFNEHHWLLFVKLGTVVYSKCALLSRFDIGVCWLVKIQFDRRIDVWNWCLISRNISDQWCAGLDLKLHLLGHMFRYTAIFSTYSWFSVTLFHVDRCVLCLTVRLWRQNYNSQKPSDHMLHFNVYFCVALQAPLRK